MKKKLILIVSFMLTVCILMTVFVGCKSAEEKEKEYYAENDAAVAEHTETLNTLMDKLFATGWKSSFVYAYTYYSKEITRGSTSVKGWPDDNEEMTAFMAFDVEYTDSQNYTIKTTVFKDVKREDYVKHIDNKNYREKFTVDKTFEYKLINGEPTADSQFNEGFNPIEFIFVNINSEYILANGLTASDSMRFYLNDSFKLSNRFMRIETRAVYDSSGNVVTRDANAAAEKKYWTGYGEDISYDWNQVYSMDNDRLTVLYTKKNQQVDSLEIYNEDILSYYTQNNDVDKSLVLKADVIGFAEMVVEFDYGD